MIRDLNMEEIERIAVSRKDRIENNSSSKGNQLKWLSEGRFVKLDLLGYESTAELLTSCLLSCSDLKREEYVSYYSCVIVEDGKELGVGCYSYDFKKAGYREYSASHFLKKYGKSFAIDYYEFRDFMYDIIGYDIKEYLDKVLCVDSIIRNDDRHFGNISFLYNGSEFIPAPIYDNGGGCLSDMISYPMDTDFETNYNSVQSKPFSLSFAGQIHDVNKLRIQYDRFMEDVSLSKPTSLRALETIKKGLKEMEGISWVRI